MILSSSNPCLAAHALDDRRLLQFRDEEPQDTPWGRCCWFYMSLEAYQRGLGQVPGWETGLERHRLMQGLWHPPAVAWEDGRRILTALWREDVDRGGMPEWTSRGPPEWLEFQLWSVAETTEQKQQNEDE